MNLGIDFGSTYTILSTYREDQQKLEAIEADKGKNNVNVPSIVSLKKNNIRYGTSAKELTGKKNVSVFKAFKMLLMEKNEAFLEERHYDAEHTPQWAAKTFLGEVIAEARKQNGAAGVENIVIGAPDVWFHSFDTLSGRALLRDICSSLEGVDSHSIRIVSEPVLASAYFAYNFMKKCQKPFDGSILIIDYGGGTLDLSLAKVGVGLNRSMEIRMLESNGAGENTDHSIGNAGIIYMESLMEHVIRKHNPEEADDIIGTAEFYEAVNRLESELFTETDVIEETFSDFGIDDLDDLEDEEMGEPIECGDEEYVVTYADLLRVYNDKIRDVFERTMDEIIMWAKEDGIDLLVSDGDRFKIALVGGFSNFWLVKKQMRDKFRFTSQDEREKDIIETKADRERAISYGATLIAAGVVGVCNTAPYSIGVCSKKDGKEYIDYMVQYRQEVDLNKPYYIQDATGHYKVFSLAENKLTDFVIDYGRANDTRIELSVKPEFHNQLSHLVKNICKTCCVGISFSGSDVLNLHIREFYIDSYPQRMADQETVIELGQFKEIFQEK